MILRGKDVEVGYGKKEVLKGVTIEVNKGEIVTIIGPNGSGKSTLIKALCRIIRPKKGQVLLDGQDIFTESTKKVAQRIAMLPQMKTAQGDVTVERLVQYGRFPHTSLLNSMTVEDKAVVEWAMDKTGIKEFRGRYVNTLSGGERQRVWIAMALAQKPEVLVLDEPTTFLDISYQIEVLELIKELNHTLGITVVMVLHDLNQAVRYSHRIYVLNKGYIEAYGDADKLLDKDLLRDVFNIDVDIYEDSRNYCHYFIPHRLMKDS